MPTPLQTRCKNMILGALTADAAAMGLHWIYDQPHIRTLAPDTPEFRTPQARDYEGVPAYFAHDGRSAGAQSQYGEQTLVMLRALVAAGGQFSAAGYAAAFRRHFGYGGSYVGYIDHATRDTLDNFRRFSDAAAACAQTIPFQREQRIRNAVLGKAVGLMETLQGADLEQALEAAAREISSDDTVRDFAQTLLTALVALPPATGAFDLQLPATAKLPALIAALTVKSPDGGESFEAQVATAIRVTNDHPVAADYGMVCARMMRAALIDGTIIAVTQAARTSATPEAAALLKTAMEMQDQDTARVARHFGMACDLPFGVPTALHNIVTAPTYTDAIRRNIYAGGDSCGRAIIVGAVMGAIHGVDGVQGIPPDWIARLDAAPELEIMMSRLFG